MLYHGYPEIRIKPAGVAALEVRVVEMVTAGLPHGPSGGERLLFCSTREHRASARKPTIGPVEPRGLVGSL